MAVDSDDSDDWSDDDESSNTKVQTVGMKVVDVEQKKRRIKPKKLKKAATNSLPPKKLAGDRYECVVNGTPSDVYIQENDLVVVRGVKIVKYAFDLLEDFAKVQKTKHLLKFDEVKLVIFIKSIRKRESFQASILQILSEFESDEDE